MFEASAREYVLQSGEAQTSSMSDDFNPNSLQMAAMMSPSAYFDRSRFINTDVVCVLHVDEIEAFLISEVRVRDFSLN